ncbi:MAG: hydrolase [Firmicutes bacterium]|nr:hydrolase [Bacillota bacterium]
MKTIKVVAAVIQDQNEFFATQRGHGEYKGGWEFPGGKVEPGESNEAALIREIREELKIDISIESYLGTVEYDYPSFHLSMACYVCEIIAGQLTLVEHLAAKWLTVSELDSVSWLPADVEVVKMLKNI